jgi:putative NADH-flavin reductase
MNTHLVALVEAAKRGREELAKHRDPAGEASAETAIRRLKDVLESEAVSDALVALDAVEDAPPIQSEPPVNLRVPYPWRTRRRAYLPQRN